MNKEEAWRVLYDALSDAFWAGVWAGAVGNDDFFCSEKADVVLNQIYQR